MGNYETLLVKVSDKIGYLTLDRPERYNALNGKMMQEELPRAWRALADDPNVWAIIFSGSGANFCTGADMKETAELGGEPVPGGVPWPAVYLTAIQNKVWKPVINAIQGMCAGGGLYFVAHGDINIASADATFFDPHVAVGQVAAMEPMELLPRVRLPVALRMVYLGLNERMPATRAYEVGLVDEVVPDGEQVSRAEELARMIVQHSPTTLMRSKRVLWESIDRLRGDALDNGWAIVQRHWRHPDSKEGPLAFAEKREPRWQPPAADI
jgi:E-phenylitaconyl-CoA hydratase